MSNVAVIAAISTVIATVVSVLGTIIVQRRVSVSTAKKADAETENTYIKSGLEVNEFLRKELNEVRNQYANNKAENAAEFAANRVRVEDLQRRLDEFEKRERVLSVELEGHKVWDQKAKRLLDEAGITIEMPPDIVFRKTDSPA